LIFVTEVHYVCCKVENEFLNDIRMSFGATKGSSQLPTPLRKGGWPLFLPRNQAEQKVSDWYPEVDTDRAVRCF